MKGSIFTGNFWLPSGYENNVEDVLRNAFSHSSEKYPSG